MATRIPFDESLWQDYLAGQTARLPCLAEVEKLTDRVTRILGGNSGPMTLQGTNTYLVGTGSSRILIDTGAGNPSWIAIVAQYLDQHGLTLSHILLTHWHGDHTGGIADLISYDTAFATRVYKHLPDPGQNNIADDQVFETQGATVRAVFTPGHAIDHMCFVLEEERALFTGDNVLGHGISVVMDLASYMKSLERMAALDCTSGYPGHGAQIKDLHAKLRQYMWHKEARVEQVYGALSREQRRGSGMTLAAIMRAIYGDMPANVADKAVAPLLSQVLWKLAEDGRVGFLTGAGTQRRWFVRSQRVM